MCNYVMVLCKTKNYFSAVGTKVIEKCAAVKAERPCPKLYYQGDTKSTEYCDTCATPE